MSEFSVDQIVRKAGGNAAFGRALGITGQAISYWLSEGKVPLERVPAVSKLTGIPRHLIRPDRPDMFPPPDEAAA